MADANLCERCRLVLNTSRALQSPWSQHHVDYDSLRVSVDNGCVICLWLSLQVPRDHVDSYGGQRSLQTFCDSDKDTLRSNKLVTVNFHGECTWAAPFDVTVSIYPNDEPLNHDIAPDLSNRNYLAHARACQLEGTDIGSDKSIGIIETWLNSCNKDHPYCPISPDRTFFPTRIIDVQNVENGTVVLRNRDEVVNAFPDGIHRAGSQRVYPEYWTLSHRWGDPKLVVQLLVTNEQLFRHGIALEGLSSTFRDAVTLVHKLGYRYIWIDSLCIIQDSDSMEDWKREAPTMKDVYGNSFCNISAIRSSHDVSFGLFGERFVEPRLFYPFSADLDLLKDEKNPTGRLNFCLDSLWVNEMNKGPLNSRGWVVQEKFLARRIIHFTQSQTYWECLECSRCEADPMDQLGILRLDASSEMGRQAREYKAALRKIIKESIPIDGRRTPTDKTHHWPTLRECWRIMVTTYSRCDLTKETDRLIAISGVAKKFEEMYINDRYFDGIWKEGLHTDLLWESNAFQGADVMRSGAFAPSWSWASVHGGSVTVPTAHQRYGGEPRPCIEFVAARIMPDASNNDSTGLLQSSELDIECFLHHFKKDAKSKTIEIFVDEAFLKKIPKMQEIRQHEVRLDTKELVRMFEQNEDFTGECIPVQEGYDGYCHLTIRYLLLEPVSVPRLRYKRLGIATVGGYGIDWNAGKCTRITLV